jgi:hypothetical protein
MPIKRNRWRNYSWSVFALLLFTTCFFGSPEPPANAQAAAALALAPIIAKALPALGTVLGNLFNKTNTNPNAKQKMSIDQMKTESDQGMKELQTFVQREQMLGLIVGAFGQAPSSLARMQVIAAKDKPTKEDMTNLNDEWTHVTETLDVIARSKPDTALFDTDAQQIKAVNNIVSADAALKTNISAQLKYDPDKPNSALLTKLRENLATLEARFQELSDDTAIELKIVADSLAVVSKPQPAPTDPKTIKAAIDASTGEVFKGNLGTLNQAVDKTKEIDSHNMGLAARMPQ